MIGPERLFPAGFPPARREPLFGSLSDVTELLSWEDLERVIEARCFDGTGSRVIQRALNLPAVGLSRVCVLTNGESVWRAPRSTTLAELRARLGGVTLRVEALEEVHPPIAELARALSLPGCAVYVNAYAAWSSSRGLALHYDYGDNLAIQVYGRKHWKIYRPTREPIRGPESSAYKESLQAAARGESMDALDELNRVRSRLFWEGELRAGDTLYMPPGWFHEVTPVGEPTLHLACEFRIPDKSLAAVETIQLPDALRATTALSAVG